MVVALQNDGKSLDGKQYFSNSFIYTIRYLRGLISNEMVERVDCRFTVAVPQCVRWTVRGRGVHHHPRHHCHSAPEIITASLSV